jgi:predicted acyl esterase
MHDIGDAAGPDRPWKRPGAGRYAVARLRSILRPPVTVVDPIPGSVVVDHDVAVATRDGTVLRVNAHRPPGDGPFPVILCAHPYGKDSVPRRTRRGGHRPSPQFRIMRQPAPVRFSSLTTWEAPDPAWWAGHGFAVVNCDLRGAGTSDGRGALLSEQEGQDVADLVEWAAAQPWSNGAVGLLGVSYLAISQWEAAAQRPPSLRAIVPWEGFTDGYRDFIRPGGVREIGFLRVWSAGLRLRTRQTYSLLAESRRRPARDDWWASRSPAVERIDVPALVCGSFSDGSLHSRGSFDGFERIGSTDRHLHTHRGGKWATFYSEDALDLQRRFLSRHLLGEAVDQPPRVRLEVRERGDRVVEVRDEAEWPLARTQWTPLHLDRSGLVTSVPVSSGSLRFGLRRHGVRFGWTIPEDVELSGPMALRLHVELHDTDDADLVVGVEKWSDGRYVGFEGSYGFGRDRIATGWQTVSFRELDPERSRPCQPVPACTSRRPLRPGEVVALDVALGPSSTLFRAGDHLRLVVAGRWLWPRNPLTGQFPGWYRTERRGACSLHWGPDRPSHLLVPVIPRADDRRASISA